MSQENVEVVKSAYAAFAAGGLDRYMEHFADDVVYRAVADAPEAGPIRGNEAVGAWLQDWIEMFDGFWFEPVELIDAGGDTVVVVERYGGRAKLSGAQTEQLIGDVVTIRDGKIAEGHEYATPDQALAAAGLSE